MSKCLHTQLDTEQGCFASTTFWVCYKLVSCRIYIVDATQTANTSVNLKAFLQFHASMLSDCGLFSLFLRTRFLVSLTMEQLSVCFGSEHFQIQSKLAPFCCQEAGGGAGGGALRQTTNQSRVGVAEVEVSLV